MSPDPDDDDPLDASRGMLLGVLLSFALCGATAFAFWVF